jgi:hypothetical protein
VVVAEALPGLQDVDVETDVWLVRLLGPVEVAPHTEAGDRFPGHLSQVEDEPTLAYGKPALVVVLDTSFVHVRTSSVAVSQVRCARLLD